MSGELWLEDFLIVAENIVEETIKFIANSDLPMGSASFLKYDVKLDLDVETQFFLAKKLGELTPFPVVGEEGFTSELPAVPYWLIDPIDGSFNYLSGIRYAAVSVALMAPDEPLIGVVGDICSGELVSARKGGGVRLNRFHAQKSDMAVRGAGLVLTAITPSLHSGVDGVERLLGNVMAYRKIRMLGSAAMSMTLLARGACEAVVLSGIHAWDVMAGCLIADEAGCKVDWRVTEERRMLGDLVARNPMPSQ
tara:strand:- start:682 stop:1434 length:753 start_codon:yes stop_codon:yes gene_type:complete